MTGYSVVKKPTPVHDSKGSVHSCISTSECAGDVGCVYFSGGSKVNPLQETVAALRGCSPLPGDPLGPIYRPSLFWTPERQVISAWSEHVPFAFWLVDVLRPMTVVELGTHVGVSYSGFCQAVKTLGLQTRCYAVDTWKGDEHAGFYDEGHYEEFADFHNSRYGAFSRLIRSTFDEALPHFDEGSIDLLHIDGLHTYEAIRHDFLSWLPKLVPKAVVLFHDTNVRERDFGVFRLWEAVSAGKHHFNFLHGHGLGVLGLGTEYPAALSSLFDTTDDHRRIGAVRALFAHLGRCVVSCSASAELGVLRAERDRVEAENARLVNEEVAGLNRQLAERRAEIAAHDRASADRDARIEVLCRDVSIRDEKIAVLGRALAERDRCVANLEQALADRDEAVAALHSSTCWRVTAPLRFTSRMAKRLLVPIHPI